ncbi:MAG: dihydrolipoamide acetyltransferase [Deltaproteobacteria bacterium]|nr:dihydrolipoamide acetyltransferase [Deltaproteobacteria bacterium]
MTKRSLMVLVAAICIAVCLPARVLAQDEPPAVVEGASEEEAPAPAEAPAAEEPPAEEVAAAAPVVDKSQYKIPDIIKKIKALQKKIKQSQQRMDDVVEIVLNISETKGAKAILALENKMSGSFVLIQTVVNLDGAPIFKKIDDDGLLESGEMEVFNGAILPGEHTLSVLLVYRGAGYGIFSYLKGYRFKVRSSHKFKVKEGKGVKLSVVGYEKGDEDTKMENRPAVKYVEEKIAVD